jgi:glycosyltransferase involved in cell wall biosynthesis
MTARPPPDVARVALVQRVVPGYRVPVFESLADAEGVDLTVFHGSNPGGEARGNTDLADVDSFEHVELPTYALSLFGLRLVWFVGLFSRARREEYDVFVCSASPSLLTVVALAVYLRATGDARLVWWGKSLGQKRDPTRAGRVLQRVGEAVRGPLYRAADACVCYSTAAAEYFQSYGVPDERVFVAYNSVDTSAMRAFEAEYRNNPDALADLRTQYRTDERDVVFFVGTHTAEKHVDNLIDAHARLLANDLETTLVVAGTGPLTDDLQDYAADVPHVHFTGRIPDEELARHLVLADVFAMPGHGGLAVQQAMTFGLPVVSTPLDGTEADLVDERENGYLVDDDDVASLTRGLRRVVEADPEQRAELGARSREIVDETVNIDSMVGGFTDAIASVTGKSTTVVR